MFPIRTHTDPLPPGVRGGVLLLLVLWFALWATAASAGQGLLEVTTDPGGARIYIDGVYIGSTPRQPGESRRQRLDAGSYRVQAVFDRRRTVTATQQVTIAPGEIRSIHLLASAEPDLVSIPAGSFLMGCQPDERGCWDDERPAREVRIAAFDIGAREVTFAEWDACVADGACTHEPDDQGWGRGERPVLDVSITDIRAYLDWLSRRTGHAYRLPSEAEWEYAARAHSTGPYYTGTCIQTNQANFDGRDVSADCADPAARFLGQTATVKSYPPNRFELYDMLGNVAEWTADCWHPNYEDAPTTGIPWMRGDCTRHVVRGGSWRDGARHLRSAWRDPRPVAQRSNEVGFRVVRVPRTVDD